MILIAHSDASYLSKPNALSRAGVQIFVSKDEPIPRPNLPILSITRVIKPVMASAAEAELAGLFITAQEMVPLQNTLIEMGWPQPKLPIQVNNSTATGYVNSTIVAHHIKSLDMGLNRFKCSEAQGHFLHVLGDR